MNDNKLFEAVGLIDDKYVEEAERHGFEPKGRRKRFAQKLASAIGFCVVTPFVSPEAPRFIKNLVCAVGFCIFAAIVSYALPRAFMRTSVQGGQESVLPAATAEPSVTEPAVRPTEEADAKIVWNEGYVTAHATKGGLPTSSYASASDSFEFYGGAALPEKIDGDCTLQEEPTCVLVSSGADGMLYSSTYTYCTGSEQLVFVAYYYSVEPELQPISMRQRWCYSSYEGVQFLLGISEDEDSDTVYTAQAVLNVSPSDNDAANDGDHYLVIRSRELPDGHYCVTPENKLTVGIEGVGRMGRDRFLNAVRTILDSLAASLADG